MSDPITVRMELTVTVDPAVWADLYGPDNERGDTYDHVKHIVGKRVGAGMESMPWEWTLGAIDE